MPFSTMRLFFCRLDKATGGLVVVAKSRLALQAFSKAFANQQVHKTYLAVVGGRLEGSGTCDLDLSGKPAVTEYTAVEHRASGRWLGSELEGLVPVKRHDLLACPAVPP